MKNMWNRTEVVSDETGLEAEENYNMEWSDMETSEVKDVVGKVLELALKNDLEYCDSTQSYTLHNRLQCPSTHVSFEGTRKPTRCYTMEKRDRLRWIFF